MKFPILLTGLLLFLTIGGLQADENWPQWRGPGQNGHAADGEYPQDLAAAESLVWSVELPGLGCSTPAVWGDHIFVTSAVEGKDGVTCYDFAGKQVWQQTFGREKKPKHATASGSNPSPVTDGKHLVVYYKSGTAACLDMTGKLIWNQNLQEEHGKSKLWWDLGTSPVIADGKAIFLVCNEGEGFLLALDLETGDTAWKTDRTYTTAEESDQAYTTPIVAQHEGQSIIVSAGADHVTGHAASDGKKLWECGLNPKGEVFQRLVASPALAGQSILVPHHRGKQMLKVEIGGQGDVTESHAAWQHKLDGGDAPTPVVTDSQIITLNDRGRITSTDVRTGEQNWKSNLPRARGRYFASPVVAGDTIYAAREDGKLFSCKILEDGIKVISERDFRQRLIASPVPIRGQLLVRGSRDLFLFR